MLRSHTAAPLLVAIGLLLTSTSTDAAAQSSAYDEMVERVVAGDSSVDFTALRLAYVTTEAYTPYPDVDLEREMAAALRKEDYPLARTLADSILDTNFVSFDAHFVAMASAAELGDTTDAEFHGRVAAGLMRSIASRDGRSPDAPMVVITVAEEYAYLRAHGLQPVSQGLGECAGGVPCDYLEVRDVRTGETFDLHFDISILRKHVLARFQDEP